MPKEFIAESLVPANPHLPNIGMSQSEIASLPKNRRQKTASEMVRRFLDGSEAKRGPKRIVEIMHALYREAVNGRSIKQIEAAKVLLARAYGKEKPSEDELNALAAGGIQLVYVQPPVVDVMKAGPVEQPVPEFIGAEFQEEE